MKKLAVALGVFTGFLAFTGLSLAQSTYTPLAQLPGTLIEGTATTDLPTYLTGAIKLIIASAGAIAVVMLVIGGTQYVAAGINPSAKSDAKERIWNAIIGLILVLTSYLILASIDRRLVQFNLTLPAVGGISTEPSAITATPTPSIPRGPRSPRAVTPPASSVSSTPATSVVSSASLATARQTVLNARINRANDYSIISNCVGNTSYDLCPRTDLNGDGRTDMTDLMMFMQRGATFDINQNRIVEIGDAPAAVSCFFKISTANVQAMLPSEVSSDSGGYSSCGGGGGGRTALPTISCNGATWLKESVLAPQCAMSSGFNNMPFGFVYGGGDQFSKFQGWVVGAATGSAVNLATLFEKTFFRLVSSGDGLPYDEYFETDVGKLTYATIAAYDLNNDGVADFNANGADITAFNACRGSSVSGACAQADFNQDGVIDSRDLAFVNFMQAYVFSGSSFIPLGWYLNWFESMFFDPTGYSDKQIISYCLGRTAFEKCAFADVNGDRKVDNADLAALNTGAPLLDFNGDGKVDLR